ncbi:MAG: (2Fe-2S)-binding protein [Rhodospirillales bacterium]|nr:(2Fe-2S)-binding protein [Rhodospirillales bacterium]
MSLTLHINGETHSVDAEEDTPLLWVIRDDLDMTGTKFGCGVAACGSCTVLVDGIATRSCQTYLSDLEDSQVTTIEGIRGPVADAVQQAWRDLDVVQCGYCQSGQILSAVSLLSEVPKPSDADIDAAMAGNVCRCATYRRIRAAIHRAAAKLES